MRIVRSNGECKAVVATAAVETSLEIDILKRSGILPHILARASVDRLGVTVADIQ